MTENIFFNLEYCPDLLIERLFSFLFWKMDDIAGTRPLPMNPQPVNITKPPDRGSADLTLRSSDATDSSNNSKNSKNDIETGSLNVSHDFSQVKENERKEIVIPQIFEVIMKLLQLSNSADQLRKCFQLIESCFCSSDLIPLLKGNVTFTDYLNNPLYSSKSFGTSESLFACKNIELIFAQKDWLLFLTDIILTFRRKWMNTNREEFISQGGLSFSESESVGGDSSRFAKSSNGDDCFSASESEVSSQNDDNNNNSHDEENAHQHPQNVHRSPQHFLHLKDSEFLQMKQSILMELTNPILDFIKLLIMYDFIQKYNVNRRWNEIFRLSLPETSNLQEEIILFIFETIHQHPLITNNNSETTSSSSAATITTPQDSIYFEISLNLLKNISYFLEQVLEKMKLSLKFSSKMIQILYSLNYHSTVELRSKMKETVLPEVRKSFIIRCLIDVAQDLYLRVDCLNEISTSLQAFLLLNETKLLSDGHIIILILGMFIEVLEDLDSSSGVNQESTSSSSYSHFSSPPLAVSHFADSASHLNKHGNVKILLSLLSIIQSCVNSSQECKKTVLKICEGSSFDPNNILVKALFNNFGLSTPVLSSHSGGGSVDLSNNPLPPTLGSLSTTPTPSSWWWTSPPPTTTATAAATASVPPTPVKRISVASTDSLNNNSNNNLIDNFDRKQSDSSISVDLEVGEITTHMERHHISHSISSGKDPKDGLGFIHWFVSSERR
jgi:hypothetical protein